jgi:hypothetical protein
MIAIAFLQHQRCEDRAHVEFMSPKHILYDPLT